MTLVPLALVGFMLWIALPAMADPESHPEETEDDNCLLFPFYTNNNLPLVHLHRGCFCGPNKIPEEDCSGLPSWVWQ